MIALRKFTAAKLGGADQLRTDGYGVLQHDDGHGSAVPGLPIPHAHAGDVRHECAYVRDPSRDDDDPEHWHPVLAKEIFLERRRVSRPRRVSRMSQAVQNCRLTIQPVDMSPANMRVTKQTGRQNKRGGPVWLRIDSTIFPHRPISQNSPLR